MLNYFWTDTDKGSLANLNRIIVSQFLLDEACCFQWRVIMIDHRLYDSMYLQQSWNYQ